MSDQVGEKSLEQALKRLEDSAQRIIQTRGYVREVEKLRMLGELIKEQLKNENINHTTGKVR